MAVIINTNENILEVPDLGLTLRTLLACAASGYAETKRRKWHIRYKNAVIGSVQVRTTTTTLQD